MSVGYTDATSDARARRQSEALVRRCWRVYHLGLGAPGERAVLRLNGAVLVRTIRRRYRGGNLLAYGSAYLGFFLWAWLVLRRLARRTHVDAVQVVNVPCALVWVAWSLRRCGTGVVLDIRDPEPELALSRFGQRRFGRAVAAALRFEERLSARSADVILCVHDEHAAVTRSHGVRHGRLRSIPNVADERLFPLQPPRAAAPRLIYHGTLTSRMGLDDVLRAIGLLRASGLDLTASLVGDGDALAELRVLAERLGLDGVVRIDGERVAPEALGARLASAGIGIVPLRRDPLTDLMLPTKLMEYVRLGVPTVVAWNPTIARYFPEDTVYYVRRFDPEGIAEALRSVLANPEAARARAGLAQRLTIAQPWQEYEGAYAECVQEAVELGRQRAAIPR